MKDERKNWYSLTKEGDTVEVEIYDEIGFFGVSARDFIKGLQAAVEPSSQVHLRVNSPGGEVFDGLAIYNYLRGMDNTITAEVQGLAASMASVVVMAADSITIPENAFLMIHNPWTIAMGDSDDLRKEADFLAKLQGNLATIYANRSGKGVDEIKTMMDAETWLDGAEAVNAGLADEAIPAIKAAACFDLSKFANVPAMARAALESGETDEEAPGWFKRWLDRFGPKEEEQEMDVTKLAAQIDDLTTERDDIAAQLEASQTRTAELEARCADEDERRKVEFNAGREQGVTEGEEQTLGRIHGLIAKYEDAGFVMANISLTDEDIATAWAEEQADNPSGGEPVDGDGNEPAGAPAFDYEARRKELIAEGKTALEAGRQATQEKQDHDAA